MEEIYRLTQKRKKEIITKISKFLKDKKNISFAYIFGSFNEKGNFPFRDIDVAVYLKPLTLKKEEVFDYETDLAIELSKIIKFPADRIDIKVLNFTSLLFQSSIFSKGLLLFFKDEEFLVRLIEKASMESVLNYEFIKRSLLELVSE